MSIKHILKTFFMHYFLIYGMTTLVTFFWCLASGEETISIDYFWKIMIFALVADAPVFVFWSRKELTVKQTVIRIAIHAVLLEILLPTAGWFIGMWRGVGGFFVFFVVVLVVDASIIGITYLRASGEAKSINTELKKRKDKKIKEECEGFGQDNRNSQSE